MQKNYLQYTSTKPIFTRYQCLALYDTINKWRASFIEFHCKVNKSPGFVMYFPRHICTCYYQPFLYCLEVINSVTSKYKEHSFLLLQWPTVLSRNFLRGNRGCATAEQNSHSRNMATTASHFSHRGTTASLNNMKPHILTNTCFSVWYPHLLINGYEKVPCQWLGISFSIEVIKMAKLRDYTLHHWFFCHKYGIIFK